MTLWQQVSRRSGFWLWILPLAFLGYFFLYPLAGIFGLTFSAAESGKTGGIVWERVLQPLGFTTWQALLSMVLTMVVGLPAALLFARFQFPGKAFLRALTTLPFILPTVVVAAGFNALLGPRGWINVALMDWFQLESPPIQLLNSLGLILLAHVFYNTSIVIRLVGSAWAQLDPRLEQAARVLGASRWMALKEVTLPLLSPSILAAGLLVFLFDFTSFGVILLLGGPRFATLEVEIYIQAMQMLNLPLAGVLSAVQLLCTLAITVIYSRLVKKRNIPLTPRVMQEGLRRPRRWEWIFVALMVILLVGLLVSPLAALGARSVSKLDADRGERGPVASSLTLDYYQELFINRRQSFFYVPPVEAARNSLGYALTTVGFSMTLGTLAAYGLNRRSKSSRWMDALLMLPLGASAVTLGLGFLVVFNGPPVDVSSFPLLIPIAHSLVALPFVVRTMQPALASIPPNLREAAAVLGAPPWRVRWEVDLPVVGRAALASAIFAFTISLGEFGATSFLARPEYPTLPVAIYRFLSQPGALNYGQALAMSTILMVICAGGILLVDRLGAIGEIAS